MLSLYNPTVVIYDFGFPTYDEFLNDDGISHMVEGGLALKIQYEMLGNSSCRIFAEIV